MAAQSGVAGSSKIGEHCIMGGQSGIGGHITVADNTTVAGQSGVLGTVKESGKVLMGTPAIPYKDYFRSYALFKKAGMK